MACKSLNCGCCGDWFETWKGYVDQDQGKGYGICKSCQDWQDERAKAEITRGINLIANALKGDRKEKFLKMPFDKQSSIVFRAMDDGLLTWSIE